MKGSCLGFSLTETPSEKGRISNRLRIDCGMIAEVRQQSRRAMAEPTNMTHSGSR